MTTGKEKMRWILSSVLVLINLFILHLNLNVKQQVQSKSCADQNHLTKSTSEATAPFSTV